MYDNQLYSIHSANFGMVPDKALSFQPTRQRLNANGVTSNDGNDPISPSYSIEESEQHINTCTCRPIWFS